MKELKQQKALLAICLALPITLKMTNEINAMKTQQETNSQVLHNNNPTQQIDTHNAFTFQFWKNIQELKKDTALTRDEYANFLKKYIQNDIAKFIAVKILTYYKKIKPYKSKPQIANLIDEKTLHTVLMEEIKTPQTSMFKQLLDEIFNKKNYYDKDQKTNAEKNIMLLCAPLRAGVDE